MFADNNWQFSIVLDEAKYPAREFTVNCLPKYEYGQTISVYPKKFQPPPQLPGTAYRTNRVGACTITNRDFKVTIEVVHGDWTN